MGAVGVPAIANQNRIVALRRNRIVALRRNRIVALRRNKIQDTHRNRILAAFQTAQERNAGLTVAVVHAANATTVICVKVVFADAIRTLLRSAMARTITVMDR